MSGTGKAEGKASKLTARSFVTNPNRINIAIPRDDSHFKNLDVGIVLTESDDESEIQSTPSIRKVISAHMSVNSEINFTQIDRITVVSSCNRACV
jgi:ATP-dependent RNA circularization protein (DNA/RNA ligase family)